MGKICGHTYYGKGIGENGFDDTAIVVTRLTVTIKTLKAYCHELHSLSITEMPKSFDSQRLAVCCYCRFMYTDDVTLTADNVLAVLYLSEKYIITALTKRCMTFLEERLTPDTAPLLLDQCMLYEEQELKEKVFDTIKEAASAVLGSDEFLDLTKEALEKY